MAKNSEHGAISNLPNILTAFRVICIPVVVICLQYPGRLGSFLGSLFFTLAFITDILDGFFARKYNSITVLGKFLDPLADKILVSVTMIMLIPIGRIPIWVVILIIIREMAVTGLRSVAINEGIVIQASPLGKYKTIFQAIAIGMLCLHYEYLKVDSHIVGMTFLWGALILTLWSGWAYFSHFIEVFSPKNREK